MNIDITNDLIMNIIAIYVVLCAIGLPLLIVYDTKDSKSIRKRAIECNVATYDQTTGKFKYIDDTIRYILTGME